ncbi:hypothetical protein ANANG_G00135520 [Anguilla anguilla]|uniref:Uncharacterized protein n=1 Tax=Anguilla anguilla TaxID=7936 RepID=A0A9D3MAW6_ANGAN|nr:hypothetical protein ANANG_G00135520 [Anguilla anguilla]
MSVVGFPPRLPCLPVPLCVHRCRRVPPRLLVPVSVFVGLPIVPVSVSLSLSVLPYPVQCCPPRPSPVLYVCLAPVLVPPGFLSPPGFLISPESPDVRALSFPRVARCAGPEFPPSRPSAGPEFPPCRPSAGPEFRPGPAQP